MITSANNEKIKYLKKIIKYSTFRKEEKKCAVEGIKIISEINPSQILEVFVSDSFYYLLKKDEKILDNIRANSTKITIIRDDIFNKISDTKTPQGIIAIIQCSNTRINNIFNNNNKIIFALDNIQDPGNMGTIIRTFNALINGSIIISNASVDIYNPKVIRASAGSIFRDNIYISDDLKRDLLLLKNKNYKIYSTVVYDSVNIDDVEYDNKTCIVIGNEGKGVNQNIIDISDKKIHIKINDSVESLNASVAASIIMYEVRNRII